MLMKDAHICESNNVSLGLHTNLKRMWTRGVAVYAQRVETRFPKICRTCGEASLPYGARLESVVGRTRDEGGPRIRYVLFSSYISLRDRVAKELNVDPREGCDIAEIVLEITVSMRRGEFVSGGDGKDLSWEWTALRSQRSATYGRSIGPVHPALPERPSAFCVGLTFFVHLPTGFLPLYAQARRL